MIDRFMRSETLEGLKTRKWIDQTGTTQMTFPLNKWVVSIRSTLRLQYQRQKQALEMISMDA